MDTHLEMCYQRTITEGKLWCTIIVVIAFKSESMYVWVGPRNKVDCLVDTDWSIAKRELQRSTWVDFHVPAISGSRKWTLLMSISYGGYIFCWHSGWHVTFFIEHFYVDHGRWTYESLDCLVIRCGKWNVWISICPFLDATWVDLMNYINVKL